MKREKNSKSAPSRSDGMIGVNDRGYPVGEDHHRSKLTQVQVDEVWRLRELKGADGRRLWGTRRLAKHMGVSRPTIQGILRGGHWDTPTDWKVPRRVRRAKRQKERARMDKRAEGGTLEP